MLVNVFSHVLNMLRQSACSSQIHPLPLTADHVLDHSTNWPGCGKVTKLEDSGSSSSRQLDVNNERDELPGTEILSTQFRFLTGGTILLNLD